MNFYVCLCQCAHVCLWVFTCSSMCVPASVSRRSLFWCKCGLRAYLDIFICKYINISEHSARSKCGNQLPSNEDSSWETRERVDLHWDSCHVLRVGLVFVSVVHSNGVDEGTGGDDLREREERKWERKEKDDAKTWRQKDAMKSNKWLRGRMGKMDLEMVLLKV